MRVPFEPVRAPSADRPPMYSEAPPARPADPFDPNLHVICQTSRLPNQVVQEYLQFCRRVHPNRTSRFGVAFYEDIDVTKALALLQACDFDVQKAKFKVVFPVLIRYCDANRLAFDPSVDYGAVLNEHIIKTTMASGAKEKSYFESLFKMVVEEKKQVAFNTIRPFVEEGLRNKCPVPPELKKELERSKKARRDIQRVLDEPRVLAKIDRELVQHKALLIIPENLEELSGVRDAVMDAQRRVRDFLSPENFQKKEFGEMARLVEDFRARNIAEDCSHEFKIFFDFFQKTSELYESVDLITRTTPLPEGSRKVSMAEAYQLLEDLSNSPLEHKVKMQMLVVVIFRKEIESEKCMMFCEDDRTTDVAQFALYAADLRKGALNFDQVVRRTELKIQTLEFLDFLHQNVRVPSRLDENLQKVDALTQLRSIFYVKETAKFSSYLTALARLRDGAGRLADQRCELADYLFEDDELVDVTDFQRLLHQANFAEGTPHLFPFVDEVGRRLTAFERLVATFSDFREEDTAQLCRRFREVFGLGLQNAFFVDQVRGELAGRIEIEFFVSRMADKYSTTPCPFKHPEFSSVLDQRTRLLPTFDECRDRVREEIEKLKDPETLAVFQGMAADRRALDQEIERLFRDPHRLAEDLESFEESVRQRFRDRELVTKAQTKARFVANKAKVDSLLVLLEATFPEVTEMEALITAAQGSVEAATALLETHWTGFLDTYEKARQTPSKFPEKELRELLDLLSKKRSHEDPLLESISGHIRTCRDRLNDLEDEVEALLGYLEKASPDFVLKTLRLTALATRLHLAGVQPAFLATVDRYIELYRRTEAHLSLSSPKTLIEVRGLLAKFDDLHIFSVNAQRLRKLLTLAEAFVGRVEPLDLEVRGEDLDSEEVVHAIQTNLRLGDFEVDWVDECLELNRRTFPLLHDDEFLEFLNKKGKRIKKYNVIANSSRKSSGELPETVEALRSVVPATTDPRTTPFCVCRERKEVGEMVQPGRCGEWFHSRCLGMAEGEVERMQEASCVACDFLERKRSGHLDLLLRRKVPLFLFQELAQSAELLANFILDPAIDFVRALAGKLRELGELMREVRAVRLLGKGSEEVRRAVHAAALLLLWLPVAFEAVEKNLLAAWDEAKGK